MDRQGQRLSAESHSHQRLPWFQEKRGTTLACLAKLQLVAVLRQQTLALEACRRHVVLLDVTEAANVVRKSRKQQRDIQLISRQVIIANLINLWSAFGKPACVKNVQSRP